MTHRLIAAAVLVVGLTTTAQTQDRVTGANYPLAQKYDRAFITRNVQEASVFPQWIGKSDAFWYSARTPTGTKYWKVDPAKNERNPLFDHDVFAAALSEASKKPLDADTLKLDTVTVVESGKTMNFVFSNSRYEWDLAANKLKTVGKATGRAPGAGPMTAETIERLRGQLGDERVNEMLRQLRDGELKKDDKVDEKKDEKQEEKQEKTQTKKGPPTGGSTTSYKNYAPDKKKYVYAFKHNLYLCEDGQPEDKATQLTTDGVEDYSFAGGGGGGFGKGNAGTAGATTTDRKTRTNVTWSPDSKAFYLTRTDSRGVKDLYLVDSVASPRPKLEQYKYPMPAEEAVRKPELHYCVVDSKKLTRLPEKWKHERYLDLRWVKSTGELRFIRRDRLQRNLEICSLDVATGTTKCLIAEGFDSAFLDTQSPRYLEESDELLWWSERSGWGHYYRYGRDGTMKNALTSGAWRASRIVDVDSKNGYVYLIGNGREPGENVYYTHLYRVKLDGTELTCLDPSTLPNSEKLMPGGFTQTSSLSPSKKYLVTTSTRTDSAPFATVRDDSGRTIMVLEETDLTALKATGWKPPETFIVKAADGTTDLYGNMWKPFDFNPKKKYPIIAHVYPGPQTEGVTYRFGAYSTNMQMAQLGFIVIQVGHRGGSPERSKAYHSFGYFNLRDYGLVDKKAAIEALAAQHPFIDVERVGIYGHSGGGFMSAAALLQKPYNEFFTAAVASAGNHDNNIYNDNWSERYHGLKEVVIGEEKQDTTTSTTGKGTGFGGGKGSGKGGRKKDPPSDEEIDWEVVAILDSLDPQDEKSIEEVERKLAELKARLATLKQESGEVGVAPPPRPAGKELAKQQPPTRFEIRVPTNAELAENLKGHLLLVHGEIDNNVHPANTMRLVDALIKANKRFEMLIIPGARHGFGAAQPYFTQRMWDFFAEHLLEDRQTGADINNKDVKRK